MSHSILPAQPSLENLKKQAKTLLRRFQAGDDDALSRFTTHHPKPPNDRGAAALADAQLVLAREYGFTSWARLAQNVDLRPELRELHVVWQLCADVRSRLSPPIRAGALIEAYAAALTAECRSGSRNVALLRKLHAPLREVSAEFTSDEARDWFAREFGFTSATDASASSAIIDPLFESAADAVVDGGITTMRALLAGNRALAQARSAFPHHASLLHYVAANGVESMRQWRSPANAVEIARSLLLAGADPDATCDVYGGGSTPLALLVSSAHPAAAGVQAALVDALCVGARAADGLPGQDPPLWTAIIFGYPQAAERLAAHGARITDVVAAAALGRLDLVTAEFAHERQREDIVVGGRVLPGAQHREFALIFAVICGRREVVEYLLTLKPDLTIREPYWNATALSAARYWKRQEIVAMLEQAGGS
jgi:hypothetical protein